VVHLPSKDEMDVSNWPESSAGVLVVVIGIDLVFTLEYQNSVHGLKRIQIMKISSAKEISHPNIF